MGSEVTIWNKVMSTALAMPGVKVDRDEFLKKELSLYCSPEDLNKAVSIRPIAGVSKAVIDKIANSCIGSHTTKVTAISTIAGMPGGLVIAATIPADMAQYYWHVFVLAQKLAYLYGFPDLRDKDGNLTDTATDMLTVFVGVMMGASAANNAIRGLAKEFAKQVVKRLPQKALTKTVYYPIIKQVAKWIGVKLTKDSFAKGLGKAIPVLGGVISGGLTLATFRPSAKRLQHKLQEQMDLLGANSYEYTQKTNNAEFEDYSDYDDISEEETMVSEDKLKLMVLINMAKIDNDFTDAKKDFISNEIENTSLSDDEQLELAKSYNSNDTFDVNLNLFHNESTKIDLLKKMVDLSRLNQNGMSFAEKLYLRKVGRAFNFTKEDIDSLINEYDI